MFVIIELTSINDLINQSMPNTMDFFLTMEFFLVCISFRFSVEVADFNFGETSSLDLEYKSFVRRLYDSIRDVIPRRRLNNETDEIDDSSQRYGVMS